MKTIAIKANIMENMRTLDHMARIKPSKIECPQWQLAMGDWNVVNGDMWCTRADENKNNDGLWQTLRKPTFFDKLKNWYDIRASIGDDVNIELKPLLMSKKRALCHVHNALEACINNYNNNNIVKKGEQSIKVYTNAHMDWLLRGQ